jgi:hypothetical protein
MIGAALEHYLSTGEAAVRLGLRDWQVARLYQRGLVEEPRRFGRFRLVAESDLPAIRRAAQTAGYLQQEGG